MAIKGNLKDVKKNLFCSFNSIASIDGREQLKFTFFVLICTSWKDILSQVPNFEISSTASVFFWSQSDPSNAPKCQHGTQHEERKTLKNKIKTKNWGGLNNFSSGLRRILIPVPTTTKHAASLPSASILVCFAISGQLFSIWVQISTLKVCDYSIRNIYARRQSVIQIHSVEMCQEIYVISGSSL